MSRPLKLRDVDPLLHAFLVVAFAIIAGCAIYALAEAL